VIGFIQTRGPKRVAVHSEQGVKLGYLAIIRGEQVFQTCDGTVVLRNVRLKGAVSRIGAQGGAFLPPGWDR
jgi:hypothetical protein